MELEQGTILVEGKPSKLQMLKRAQEIGKYGTNKTVYVLDTSALLAHYLDEEGTDLASRYTPKPANEVHLKTGQRKRTQDNISFNLNQLFQQDFSLLPWRRVVVN